jgi:hypothetical protein
MEAVSPVMPGSEPIEIILGKDQPEYMPLPVVYLNSPSVPMLSRWRLSEEERAAVAEGADIVLTQLTFGGLFRPVNLQIVAPDAMPALLE